MCVVSEAVPVMPRVWDLPTEQAKTVLIEHGLAFRVELSQSDAIAAGDLISVSPRPGTKLDGGVEVVLTISSGPPIMS